MQILNNTRRIILQNRNIFNPFKNYNSSSSIISAKKFCSTAIRINTKLLDKINLENINKHKNAILFENDNCEVKIIFPDMRHSINLHLHDESLTISQLIEKSQKKLEKESILTHSYLDCDGVEISGATKASMLFRLDKFKISLNRGEKVYTCFNFNYLANQRLSQSTDLIPNEFYEKVERDISLHNIPFHVSYIINKNSNAFKKYFKENSNHLTYKEIFNNILNNKYFPLHTFHFKNEVEKDRRVWKGLNLFFYLTVSQTIVLNLCVFVFFNWDIMEPITQCITYANVICGYYYWAYSNGGDYEISSMIAWLKSRNILYRSLHQAYSEKADIEQFVEKRSEN